MIRKINKVLTGCIIAITLASVSTIAMAAAVPAKIVGVKVNIRKGPKTSSDIITKLSNSRVSVVDKTYAWYKISFNGKTGWVNDNYLKLIPTNGTINANGVNFRKSASTSGIIIKSLKKQPSIQILDTINGWNKIKVGSQVGYVSSKFVVVNSSTAKSTSLKTSRSMATVSLTANNDDDSVYSKVIDYAKEFNGVKYVYGGDNPHIGFDCSGFIGYVYKKFGVTLNRSAEAMYSNGTRVSKSQLKAGDLLFFDASSRKASGAIDHAGIYLGGDTFIHASSSNGEVRIQKLSEYRGTYIGAKRVI